MYRKILLFLRESCSYFSLILCYNIPKFPVEIYYIHLLPFFYKRIFSLNFLTISSIVTIFPIFYFNKEVMPILAQYKYYAVQKELVNPNWVPFSEFVDCFDTFASLSFPSRRHLKLEIQLIIRDSAQYTLLIFSRVARCLKLKLFSLPSRAGGFLYR